MFTQMTVVKVSGTQNATKGHECGNEPWEKKGSEQEREPERTGRSYFSQNSVCMYVESCQKLFSLVIKILKI